MNWRYVWFRILKKLQGVGINNSIINSDAKIEAGSVFVGSTIDKFSYCGYDCYICNTNIGKFCSISDNVSIGGGLHPMHWVSTSPAFYYGRDSISKRLASLEFDSSDPYTKIGNDVWIGRGAYIKAGVNVGDGAVIGMGSVVTKDVPAYAVVVGNPAIVVKYRFSKDNINSIQSAKWWEWGEEKLLKNSKYMDDVEAFITISRPADGTKA